MGKRILVFFMVLAFTLAFAVGGCKTPKDDADKPEDATKTPTGPDVGEEEDEGDWADEGDDEDEGDWADEGDDEGDLDDEDDEDEEDTEDEGDLDEEDLD